MKTDSISVVIVDDHPLFRKGIRLYLEDIDEIEILNELTNGKEALIYLEESHAKVDLLIMDLQMPEMDGEEASSLINKKWPDIKIVVLTSYGSWDKVYSMLNSGVAGYLLKDTQPEELVLAIKTAYTGGTYFGKEVAKELINRAGQKQELKEKKPDFDDLIEPLTEREVDVLKLIGKGMGNNEIAETLHISNNTVKTHVSNIFQKLTVTSRTQAAFYAMEKGLI
ncbi:response regulator [Natronospora cellulosivora (SeqCode)]